MLKEKWKKKEGEKDGRKERGKKEKMRENFKNLLTPLYSYRLMISNKLTPRISKTIQK